MRRLLLLLIILAIPAAAQIGGSGVIFQNSDPGGACANPTPLRYNFLLGKLWGCVAGTWTQLTSGGGAPGTVTSFSAGTLSPLFTTSVATATTTPALSFAQSTAAANLMFAGPASGGAVAPTFRSIVTADLPVVHTRRVCMMTVGADNGASALVDGDLGPQGRQCFIPYAATVVEVTVAADAGTPSVLPAKNHAGSATSLLSGALATAGSGGLACSNTGGTTGIDGATTCSGTLNSTSLAAGDWLQLTSGTAGGTAKRMSISVTFTVN